MPAKRPKGQALPEYVLTAAVMVLVAIGALKAFQHSFAQAEEQQAWFNFIPSP